MKYEWPGNETEASPYRERDGLLPKENYYIVIRSAEKNLDSHFCDRGDSSLRSE